MPDFMKKHVGHLVRARVLDEDTLTTVDGTQFKVLKKCFDESNGKTNGFVCSNCHTYSDISEPNYCAWCGAENDPDFFIDGWADQALAEIQKESALAGVA